MAHFPKPFFRPSRGLWYVQLDGKQCSLGADKTAAFKAYHVLMQQRSEGRASPPTPSPTTQRLVVVIVDEFLDWCEKHRAADTYRWYKDRLNSFCKTINATLTADQLKPYHVQKWVDNYGVRPRK
jgi:hypothetical protein